MNTLLHNILQVPVPRDIPLPLPLPEWLLVALLIFSFLLHILFVNLMLGGTVFTLWAEILGLKKKEYDTVAHEIAATVTVNKSLAVVLGVAPLLSINVLYTVYFYSANTLTGLFWISVIPLLIVAFLLAYLHKYTWERLQNNKFVHIAIIAASALIFLFIPLIFLANVNLMLFPEKWGTIEGFFSALTLPNVFPRYLHFICASMAVTGLFIFYYFGRNKYGFEEKFHEFSRYYIRKKAMNVAFIFSLIQFIFGPLLLLTLPAKGIGWNMYLMLGIGVVTAIFALSWMWKSITGPEPDLRKRFWPIVVMITITVIAMGTGRHFYRANSLEPHQALMQEKTKKYLEMVKDAQINKDRVELVVSEVLSPGQIIFEQNCAVCHQEESRLVGPSINEIVTLYEGNEEGMIAWIIKPGRKRTDYPVMPGFPQLTDEQLNQVTDYLFDL